MIIMFQCGRGGKGGVHVSRKFIHYEYIAQLNINSEKLIQ